MPSRFRLSSDIHPVFTSGLLEGYGSIADELLADRPTLEAVIIPFGVGGLTIGVSRRLKILKPNIKIYACEVETAAPLSKSFQLQRAAQIERRPSFVDAVGTPEVLPQVFEQVRPLISESLVVKIEDVRRAVRALTQDAKLVCEGAAAASLAAALKLASVHPDQEIACLLTGGNISPDVHKECLEFA